MSSPDLNMGTDVEFFFTKNNTVVGAEHILEAKTVNVIPSIRTPSYKTNEFSKIEIDGVQAELQPTYSKCRAYLANDISVLFKKLLESYKDKALPSIQQSITMSKEEFDKISEQNKVFGCKPDYNSYTQQQNQITVNPLLTKQRTAGGHIHLGAYLNFYLVDLETKGKVHINENSMQYNIHNFIPCDIIGDPFYKIDDTEITQSTILEKLSYYYVSEELKRMNHIRIYGDTIAPLRNVNTCVRLLDMLVGNTCVLFEHSNEARQRRTLYGRCGDYRLTPYGIEYRTLSNFWLHAYPLMSLVFMLAKKVIEIMMYHDNIVKELLSSINKDDIVNAVNNADLQLAKKNFEKIEGIVYKNFPQAFTYSNSYSTYTSHEQFMETIKAISVIGYTNVWKHDPAEHWAGIIDAHNGGWADFCNSPDKFSNIKQSNINKACKKF